MLLFSDMQIETGFVNLYYQLLLLKNTVKYFLYYQWKKPVDKGYIDRIR
jgi:hypothetical protein